MSKPSRRKQQRQARKQRTEREKQLKREKRREAFNKFPELVFEKNGAPPPLVNAVRDVLKTIVIEHERLLPPSMSACFHQAKTEGFLPVLNQIELSGVWEQSVNASLMAFHCILAELVVQRLPENMFHSKTTKGYLPFSMFYLCYGEPRPNTILVTFRNLQQVKTDGGTAYYAPYEPTIAVGGQTKVIAFSDHAIARYCQRSVSNSKNYSGLGDVFAYLHECIYFEPWTDQHGSLGFTMYELCRVGFASYRFVEAIVEQPDPLASYAYRLGYCPAVRVDGFLKATTFLTPGMEGTPEYDLCLRQKTTSHDERKTLREQANRLVYSELVKHNDFSLLKLFHDAGIAQVKTIDQPLYHYQLTESPAHKKTIAAPQLDSSHTPILIRVSWNGEKGQFTLLLECQSKSVFFSLSLSSPEFVEIVRYTTRRHSHPEKNIKQPRLVDGSYHLAYKDREAAFILQVCDGESRLSVQYHRTQLTRTVDYPQTILESYAKAIYDGETPAPEGYPDGYPAPHIDKRAARLSLSFHRDDRDPERIWWHMRPWPWRATVSGPSPRTPLGRRFGSRLLRQPTEHCSVSGLLPGRLLLTACVTASPRTPLWDISSHVLPVGRTWR